MVVVVWTGVILAVFLRPFLLLLILLLDLLAAIRVDVMSLYLMSVDPKIILLSFSGTCCCGTFVWDVLLCCVVTWGPGWLGGQWFVGGTLVLFSVVGCSSFVVVICVGLFSRGGGVSLCWMLIIGVFGCCLCGLLWTSCGVMVCSPTGVLLS